MLFKRHSLGISLNPTKTQDKSMQCSTKDDGSTSIATSIHSSSSPSLHHGSFRNNRNIPPFVKKAVFIASLGGILFGYDMGVISGMYLLVCIDIVVSNTIRYDTLDCFDCLDCRTAYCTFTSSFGTTTNALVSIITFCSLLVLKTFK